MYKNKFFSDLDLDLLTMQIQEWVSQAKYSYIIKKISLLHRFFEETADGMGNITNNTRRYVLVAAIDPFKVSHGELMETLSTFHEGAGHLLPWITLAYQSPEKNKEKIRTDWLWYNLVKEEKAGREWLNQTSAFGEAHTEIILFDSNTSEKKPKKYNKSLRSLTIQTPKGTKWNDLKLTIRNSDYTEILEIIYPEERYNFKPKELGFKGYKDNPHGIAWKALVALTKNEGWVLPEEGGANHLKDGIIQLRKKLKAIFPDITDSPVLWDRNHKGWRTAFRLQQITFRDE